MCVCLENYSLDPALYYTSPGFSFDALSKVSRQKLELPTDIDTLLSQIDFQEQIIHMCMKHVFQAS